jgi:hypothetical protein
MITSVKLLTFFISAHVNPSVEQLQNTNVRLAQDSDWNMQRQIIAVMTNDRRWKAESQFA